MKKGLTLITLIELMFILAMISIMAAVAIPSSLKAREETLKQQQQEQNKANNAKIVAVEKGAPIKEFSQADYELMIARHSVKEAKKKELNTTKMQLEQERAKYGVRRLFEINGSTIYGFQPYGLNCSQTAYIAIPNATIAYENKGK